MSNITPHFTWEEVERSATADKNGIQNYLPPNLTSNVLCLAYGVLEPLRAKFSAVRGKDTPLTVNSWYRCKELNQIIKGASGSAHMTADAADLVPDGLDRLLLWPVVLEMLVKGFPIDRAILYEDEPHIHVQQSTQKQTSLPKRIAFVKVHTPGTNGAAPNQSYVDWAIYKGPLKGS